MLSASHQDGMGRHQVEVTAWSACAVQEQDRETPFIRTAWLLISYAWVHAQCQAACCPVLIGREIVLVQHPVAGFCGQLGTCSTSGLINGGSWQDRRGQTMLIFCLLTIFYQREVYLTCFSCPFPIEGSLDGKVCYSKARPICLTTQHT